MFGFKKRFKKNISDFFVCLPGKHCKSWLLRRELLINKGNPDCLMKQTGKKKYYTDLKKKLLLYLPTIENIININQKI